jgi:hypothetical protein
LVCKDIWLFPIKLRSYTALRPALKHRY